MQLIIIDRSAFILLLYLDSNYAEQLRFKIYDKHESS